MKNRRKISARQTAVCRAHIVLLICGALIFGLTAAALAQECPADMQFVPGGETIVVYSGDRWGGTVDSPQSVDDFCIDEYEASQPDATADRPGSWAPGLPIPAAESMAGVLPWASISWTDAQQACAAAGKRLPTLAEWQTAYSGYYGAWWPWGTDHYDPRQAASCYINEPVLQTFPTGGCCFENCEGAQCFTTCDMLGNLAEWVAGLWEPECYGDTQVLSAGASVIDWFTPNRQEIDPANPDCWKFSLFAQRRFGLHHHDRVTEINNDDGFRCAKSLGDDDAGRR